MTRAFTADRRLLAALRLAAQGIAGDPFAQPAEVVRHLLCMQAQDYPGALWAVGLRTANATHADVERAIADREVVRSWPMRGTLHLTPAEDLDWMLRLTGQRIVASAAGRHRQLGLDETHFTLAAATAERVLGGGGVLTRAALLSEFASAGIDVDGQRGAHLLLALSARRVIVFGPMQGKTPTFALLDEWVPQPRQLAGDEALAEFVLRYLSSHGPATIRDFAWWSSLTLTDARRGLAAVESQLDALEVDGATYYHRPGLEPAPPGVVALPGFDEYVLGYQDRSAQLSPEFATTIVPGGNGMFLSTVVVGGEIVGTWRRTTRSTRVAVEVSPFAAMSKRDVAAFDRQLERYGRFLGVAVESV